MIRQTRPSLITDVLDGVFNPPPMPGDTPEWFPFPDAYIDLQPNSTMQMLMDDATYPTGRRRVLWHPIVGKADVQVDSDWFKAAIWGGVFEGSDALFQAVTGGCVTETLDPATSDLVVTMGSQRIGQSTIGTVFPGHVHSATAEQISQIVNPGQTVRTETSSPEIASRVRELLTTPGDSGDWQGDLK